MSYSHTLAVRVDLLSIQAIFFTFLKNDMIVSAFRKVDLKQYKLNSSFIAENFLHTKELQSCFYIRW